MNSVPVRLSAFVAALAVAFAAAFLAGRAAGPIDDDGRSPDPAHLDGTHKSRADR